MNNQSFDSYQDHYNSEEKDCLCSSREFKQMKDEIELLREQVESLKMLLKQEYQRTDEYRQELLCLNDDLARMSLELHHLTLANFRVINEDKKVNNEIKNIHQSGKVTLSEFLHIIDSDRVKKLN